MIKKLFQGVLDQRDTQRREQLYRNLIRHEAKIGGKVFGPIPKGVRREFFCLDQHTWVWHEEWTDSKGQRQIKTTHYSVRPDTILKTQDGKRYQPISRKEALRLAQAAQLYQNRIEKELYSFAG